jgi:hypothetical protein
VELPLLCAQLFDPDETGLAYWYAGSPQGDSRAEFCERRLQCYDLVLDSLSMFEEQSLKEDSSISNEYQSTRAHAYELAFASDDEMFHSTMYDWLIERGHADELLQVSTAPVTDDSVLTSRSYALRSWKLTSEESRLVSKSTSYYGSSMSKMDNPFVLLRS